MAGYVREMDVLLGHSVVLPHLSRCRAKAGQPGEKPYTYRLSSNTCLAGDITGDYSFEQPVHVGDRLYFQDMAIYSMVKNNTFNGMALPSIAVMKEDGECEMIKKFGYQDFKGRLS